SMPRRGASAAARASKVSTSALMPRSVGGGVAVDKAALYQATRSRPPGDVRSPTLRQSPSLQGALTPAPPRRIVNGTHTTPWVGGSVGGVADRWWRLCGFGGCVARLDKVG